MLDYLLVKNAIKQMLAELDEKYQKWCKEHELTPYKAD